MNTLITNRKFKIALLFGIVSFHIHRTIYICVDLHKQNLINLIKVHQFTDKFTS